MNDERCCGTCRYYEHENIDDGWVCCNGDSEYCAEWTDYGDICDVWEGLQCCATLDKEKGLKK